MANIFTEHGYITKQRTFSQSIALASPTIFWCDHIEVLYDIVIIL